MSDLHTSPLTQNSGQPQLTECVFYSSFVSIVLESERANKMDIPPHSVQGMVKYVIASRHFTLQFYFVQFISVFPC